MSYLKSTENNQRRSRLYSIVWIVVIAAAMVSGCAPNSAFHKDTYIEHHPNHTFAIAEYSERGNHFSDASLNSILEMMRQKSEDSGVVTLVFVHGWHHNAQEEDSNLVNFKNVVAEIAQNDETFRLGGRHLVGLYVGWRGASIELPFVRGLSYWERKSAAEQFGSTGLSRLILELDAIDQQKDTNVLVTIGHSFGGAAVLTAMVKPLLSRILEPDNNHASSDKEFDHCDEVTCGVGDGIFLLNPAIEANQVLSLLEGSMSSGKTYSRKQPPLLVTLSSEADKANKFAFPVGQTLGLLLNWKQRSLNRDYFKHQSTGEIFRIKEENLDSNTVGNFAPFLTHRLDVPSLAPDCTNFESLEFRKSPLSTCNDYINPDQCGPMRFPGGLDRTPDGVYVADRPEFNPLYFIRTNRHFMARHSDIFNPHVIAFLTAQLNQGLLAQQNRSLSSNTLYNKTDSFLTEYRRFLKFACEIDFREEK